MWEHSARQRNIDVCSAVGKAISVTYFECTFVALGTQHGAVLSSVTLPGLQTFPHYLTKHTIFYIQKGYSI